MRHLAPTAAAALVVGLVATGASWAPADAHGGGGAGRTVRTGTCQGDARWKITSEEDDGRIAVEAEIDSNRTGQRWVWKLTHDGSRSAAGAARTAGRSGSFSVERRLVDAPGADRFTFRATHGDQVCVATIGPAG